MNVIFLEIYRNKSRGDLLTDQTDVKKSPYFHLTKLLLHIKGHLHC